MAWFSGKVSLGGFPDLAGAVNKLQESVKNIEKNFDTALGFEEKSESSNNEASGLWSSERKPLFDPVLAFMGQKSEESAPELSGKLESSHSPPEVEEKEKAETDRSVHSHVKTTVEEDKQTDELEKDNEHLETVNREDTATLDPCSDSKEAKLDTAEVSPVEVAEPVPAESSTAVDMHETNEQKTQMNEILEKGYPIKSEESSDSQADAGNGPDELTPSSSNSVVVEETKSAQALLSPTEPIVLENDESAKTVEVDRQINDGEADAKVELRLSSAAAISDSADPIHELEKVKMELKMMESALQGAARQAQLKAWNRENPMKQKWSLCERNIIKGFRFLKGRFTDKNSTFQLSQYLVSEGEFLSYLLGVYWVKCLLWIMSMRLSMLFENGVNALLAFIEAGDKWTVVSWYVLFQVYALTKERDTLRREQNKKSDAAALLKEKDEIINQVMAEGEELSKKQAAQEAQIRKLRAQVEENKVESIKKDKTATEKLLQETIEKHQAELAAQKDFYTNALNAAKEAEALAEARANNEARTELESRLREAEEREAMLVQTLEELRQTLSRKEQQAVFREDMLRRDIEDLQKRYQASERRCEELITQVPESTRPLLRQIEAMQETTSRRAEAWAAVERSLNSRLQEAEAKAAAAEERERSLNDRLSQTLSRINVLEAQISCLRAEQTQISRSLEKERQRAAENRQEYLAAKEEADTQEGRANQLEEEIRELRRKHKQELQDAYVQQERLQQEVEREKAARLDLERTMHVHSMAISEQAPMARHNSASENGSLSRKLSTASSLGSMEESYYLQASLDSSDGFSEKRNIGEATLSPLYMKSMTPSAFESALRQKEGELASYMSRLSSMEAIRDSLAEELVKMTEQCEKLKAEAATLPGIRAELEALRRRHTAALELMGERDEELEELRADIVDLKEMYREQVNLLVNKIQIMNSSAGNTY
ncbi:hypothetical protein GOBAR_AA07762 [Gossypium barbadense]|uniref:TATA element modulatory factor 1 TATA binding domain-containing protein n=1 Tax=Gossypium barbadense TaxID=3634 RepID=A0A2P5YBA8_GOSBA|nr:hypothetical protein GOBAR_AA07762 [Gossypium barbadense]